MRKLKIKRVYEDASTADGYRILVDCIGPRGVSKEDVKLDDWIKEIAPSHDLSNNGTIAVLPQKMFGRLRIPKLHYARLLH
jgi:uncharacterized protein YeaO (DUF488 family)